MATTKKVFISSTARDLPDYRSAAIHACQRLGFVPVAMEEFGPDPQNAIEVCRQKVIESDLYLGIFAYRYGYMPDGYDVSITEMEYNWAMERGLPVLIFMVDEDLAWPPKLMDRGAAYDKLEQFKARLRKEHVIRPFKDPEQFREDLFLYLPQWREARTEQRLADVIHYVSDIPAPPEPYIAHPYTLLQAKGLVGRQQELSLLTDWVAKPGADVYQARVLNVVAIGGMGKSALTWKWFSEIAPNEMKPLAGRLWWSFYESDATFENFVIRALAYVTERPREEIQKLSPPERETQLLHMLDREPFLLVLDGLERILIAYARMDAARLQDSEIDDYYQLRKTADPHVGNFLRKLTRIRQSRVLVSTRLYPADLQDRHTADPLAGSHQIDLSGLSEGDALELWRSFGVSGARDDLLRLFQTFRSHPLMIKALAGEVRRFRRAPGDFDQWQKHHRDFDPYRLPQVQDAMAHVLSFALQGLDEPKRHILHTIAAFRRPAAYETLLALLVGDDKSFPNEAVFDAALGELEDRGLLGWDTRSNRYDLHPIVRGVVWARLSDSVKEGVYETMRTHFEALPKLDAKEVKSLADLTSTIELCYTLISLGCFMEALELIGSQFLIGIFLPSVNHEFAELLELLLPDGGDQDPRLNDRDAQVIALFLLAHAYQFTGHPGQVKVLYHRVRELTGQMDVMVVMDLESLFALITHGLHLAGELYKAESITRHNIELSRKATNSDFDDEVQEFLSLLWLVPSLAARGNIDDAEQGLERMSSFLTESNTIEATIKAYRAQCELWLGNYTTAKSIADQAWESAPESGLRELTFIQAARLQGMTALGTNDLAMADERLRHALTRARTINLVEEELQALIGLAEVARRQGDFKAARDLLDEVWEPTERGPFPLFHADACNVLAQIERDVGNTTAAITAATEAYKLAWCDGPPYAYHWGLEAARKHLRELGAPEPTLPPFDPSRYDPMPDVEINPLDEEQRGE